MHKGTQNGSLGQTMEFVSTSLHKGIKATLKSSCRESVSTLQETEGEEIFARAGMKSLLCQKVPEDTYPGALPFKNNNHAAQAAHKLSYLPVNTKFPGSLSP